MVRVCGHPGAQVRPWAPVRTTGRQHLSDADRRTNPPHDQHTTPSASSKAAHAPRAGFLVVWLLHHHGDVAEVPQLPYASGGTFSQPTTQDKVIDPWSKYPWKISPQQPACIAGIFQTVKPSLRHWLFFHTHPRSRSHLPSSSR